MADKGQEPTPKTQQTQPKEGEPIEIPIPKEEDFEKLVRRAVKPVGRTELHDRVDRELVCFPNDTHEQRKLRMVYYDTRLTDLGKDSEHPGATALESAERAVGFLQESEHSFQPEFDRDALQRLDAASGADD